MDPRADESGQPAVVLSSMGPADWRRWRALRLAALGESPEAFGSTLGEWSGSGDTESRWRNRLASVPLNLVASVAGRDVGMVSGVGPVGDEAELISLWVAPDARGQGVGDALVGAVVRWAAQRGALRVALSVRAHNAPAIGLYLRSGFLDAGPAPSDLVLERRMVRPLGVPEGVR